MAPQSLIQRSIAALTGPKKWFQNGNITTINGIPIQGGELQPSGGIPTKVKGRISGWGEPPNQSASADIAAIQTAIRSAERGETRALFALYRDIVCNYGHVQTEIGKRKMAVVGQPETIFPYDKSNAADLIAAKAIKLMIEHCENWTDAQLHLLDASVWPVSCEEKIFAPNDEANTEIPIRYWLKRLEPVNPALFCYLLPYVSAGGYNLAGPILPNVPGSSPMDTVYDPDQWEPELRFYRTFPSGYIDYSWGNIYAPDPARHVVHRGNFMSGFRDNFGGPMRGVMFWWMFATSGRDWFARFMERYGSPIPVAYVDAQQKDTIEFLKSAFSEATKLGALFVDKRAKVELQTVQVNGAADGYVKYIEFCHDEISKIVIGQTLSSGTANTGLGSGQAGFHAQVRDDIRQFDHKKLSETNQKQIFRQFLDINSIPGRTPRIAWGGASEDDQASLSTTLKDLALGGLEPTDDAMEVLSERFGFNLQRKELVLPNANANPNSD